MLPSREFREKMQTSLATLQHFPQLNGFPLHLHLSLLLSIIVSLGTILTSIRIVAFTSQSLLEIF
jgi:hypothetical protein